MTVSAGGKGDSGADGPVATLGSERFQRELSEVVTTVGHIGAWVYIRMKAIGVCLEL